MSEDNFDFLRGDNVREGKRVEVGVDNFGVKFEKKAREPDDKLWEKRVPKMRVKLSEEKKRKGFTALAKLYLAYFAARVGYVGIKWFLDKGNELRKEQEAELENMPSGLSAYEGDDFANDYMATYLNEPSIWGRSITDVRDVSVPVIMEVYGPNWMFIPNDINEYARRATRPGEKSFDPSSQRVIDDFWVSRQASKQMLEDWLKISFDPNNDLYIGYTYDQMANNPGLMEPFLKAVQDKNPAGPITDEVIDYYRQTEKEKKFEKDGTFTIGNKDDLTKVEELKGIAGVDQQFFEIAGKASELTGLPFEDIAGVGQSLIEGLDFITDDEQLIELVMEATDIVSQFIKSESVVAGATPMLLVGLIWLNLQQKRINNKVKALYLSEKWEDVYHNFMLGNYREPVEDLVKTGRDLWKRAKKKFIKS